MTPEWLASAAAVVLSLLFSYLPPLAHWYAGLDGDQKRIVMGAAIVLVGAGAVGLACAGWAFDFGIKLECDRPGLVMVVNAIIAALVANQATYLISARRKAKAIAAAVE